MLSARNNTDERYERMPPNIIRAARYNDYDEASDVIENYPQDVSRTDTNLMNAIQVALIEFNDEMVLYLLENTNISLLHRDKLGRDSFDIAYQIGSEKVFEAINNKWNEQMSALLNEDKPTVVSLNPNPK